MPINICKHKGVADRSGFYEVNIAPQQLFQIGLGNEERVEPNADAVREFQEEIYAAPVNAIPLADGGDLGAMPRGGVVHGRSLPRRFTCPTRPTSRPRVFFCY